MQLYRQSSRFGRARMACLEDEAYALRLAERSEFELGVDDMEDFAFMAGTSTTTTRAARPRRRRRR